MPIIDPVCLGRFKMEPEITSILAELDPSPYTNEINWPETHGNEPCIGQGHGE